MSHYKITITCDDEVLDGYDLAQHADRVAVGCEVESAMGMHHVIICSLAEVAG